MEKVEQEEAELAEQLDAYAKEMIGRWRKDDRQIGSAATRIRYEPRQAVNPGASSNTLKTRLATTRKLNAASNDQSMETGVVQHLPETQDGSGSEDSFLRALKEDDDDALLQQWREKHREAVATFKELLTDSEEEESSVVSSGLNRSRYSTGASSYLTDHSRYSSRTMESNRTSGTKVKGKRKALRSVGSTKSRSSNCSKSRGSRNLNSCVARNRSKTRQSDRLSRSRSKTRRSSSYTQTKPIKRKVASKSTKGKHPAKSPPSVMPSRSLTKIRELERQVQALKAEKRNLEKDNKALLLKLSGFKAKLQKAHESERVAISQNENLERIIHQQRIELRQLKRNRATSNQATKLQQVHGELERTKTELASSRKQVLELNSDLANLKLRDKPRNISPTSPTSFKRGSKSSLRQNKIAKPWAATPKSRAASPSSRNSTPSPPPPPPPSTKNNLSKTYDSLSSSSTSSSERTVRSMRSHGSSRVGQPRLNTSLDSEPRQNRTAFERYRKLKALYAQKYSQ